MKGKIINVCATMLSMENEKGLAMRSYQFTLSDINNIQDNKSHLRELLTFWQQIGSVQDTLAYRYVKNNMPTTFDKYRIGILSTYFKEAYDTADAILSGFMVTTDDLFKMKLYAKAEYYVVCLSHIYHAAMSGYQNNAALPRDIQVHMPFLPDECRKDGLCLKVEMAPNTPSGDAFSERWVLACDFQSYSTGESLIPTTRFETMRELISSLYGKSVAKKCFGSEMDCPIVNAVEALVRAALSNVSSRLKLNASMTWHAPGKVGEIVFSTIDGYEESLFIEHMMNNVVISHPFGSVN